MTREHMTPGEVEVFGSFSKHLGPRCSGAGLGIQFHYNQEPGIYFKTEVPAEFREAIAEGLQAAMRLRFPDFLPTGGLWVTHVEAHPVDSNCDAFRRAARMVVEQAYWLSHPDDA